MFICIKQTNTEPIEVCNNASEYMRTVFPHIFFLTFAELCVKIMAFFILNSCRNPNWSPGGYATDEWPRYTNTTRQHIILQADLINHRVDKSRAIAEGPRIRECAFWREYLPTLTLKTGKRCDACSIFKDVYSA